MDEAEVLTVPDAAAWRARLEAEGGSSAGVRLRLAKKGTGRIGGREVPCCSPGTQLAAHLGYEPDADDCADVAALCARFGLPLPPAYAA